MPPLKHTLDNIRRVFARPRTNPRMGEIVLTGGAGISGGFLSLGQEKRPSAISYDDMEAMTADPQIGASLALVKMPITGLNWRISCPDDPKTEIAPFAQNALGEIWGAWIRDTLTALDYGFAAMEKRWIRGSDGRWKWRTYLPVHPRDVVILRNGNDFDGFRQGMSPNAPKVDADKAFIYSNDRPFGNLYGKPRTYAAYNPWWISKHIMRFASVFFERVAQPIREGRAPASVEKIEDGVSTNINGIQFLYDSVQVKLMAGSTDYTLSSERDPETKEYLWDIVYKEIQNSGVGYIDFLKYLDTMKSRGVFIPDLTVFQNITTGSRAMSESHGEIFWQMERGQISDIKNHIDMYMLPQLVAYNFGPDAPRIYWDYEPLTPETIIWLKRLVDRMVQSGTAVPDIEEISRRLGIGITKQEKPAPAPLSQKPGEAESKKESPTQEKEQLEKILGKYEADLSRSHLW